MANLDRLLDDLIVSRENDPLAPATVITPSRLAALQLRRRLAARGPFAGIRFEPLSRLAELLAAATLAREGKRPLARPIADYVSTRIARESLSPLNGVSDVPGYARALRQTFRRLRRGGFHDGDEVLRAGATGAAAEEIARLYSRFRAETAAFYDDEDLMEAAAAVLSGSPAAVLPELGAVFAVPPLRQSAAAALLLDQIASVAGSYQELEDEAAPAVEERFILAPDAASETRSVVKSIIEDLERGVRLDEIAVFSSGDRSYRPLLEQALAAASLPATSLPGTPLIETPAGRGALGLLKIALEGYSRTSVFDFLGLAPLRRFLPVTSEGLRLDASNWQRIAAEAGVTKGLQRWRDGLAYYIEDREERARPESDVSDAQRAYAAREIAAARNLLSVVEALAATLQPLEAEQPASSFVPAFRSFIERWFDRDAAGYERVIEEVDQLGTIDAVGGAFSLASFVDAFEANLTLASLRQGTLGGGVLLTDHRQAAGLSFRRVYLCGAYEGALPAIATSEPLLQDADWARLRQSHPFVDDLELRAERSREAVGRVRAAADGGCLTWSAPTQAAGAAREFYPSSLMTEAARRRDPSLASASDLRRAAGREWLVRPGSPLGAMLTGTGAEPWELRLREAVALKRAGGGVAPAHPLYPAVQLVESRRARDFTAYDGNVGELASRYPLAPDTAISPTALETYATCGMKYLFAYVLRLRDIDEPEERQTIGSLEAGNLVHKTLQRFFSAQKERGRPGLEEAWTLEDADELLRLFGEELEGLRQQGRAGLDIYLDHDRARLHADLVAFLDYDSEFRATNGVVPDAFEQRIEVPGVGGINFRGFADRIDRSPDGRKAVVIDYKTGSASRYKLSSGDPFSGGKRLQLAIYSLALKDVEEVRSVYWFISAAEKFEQVGHVESAENRTRFEKTVEAILEAIRRGVFPAVSGEESDYFQTFENCTYCDFTRICSRRRVQELQGKSEDAAIRTWFNVGETARAGSQP